MDWKHNTPNAYLQRARVTGPLRVVYPPRNGHDHFVITIGNSNEQLEVVYNNEFGKLPPLREGMQVEACGDYITSTAQTGPYPPSPVGAIIHWIHRNPKGTGHDSGYVALDGVLFGWDLPQKDKHPPRKNPRFLSIGADLLEQYMSAVGGQ